MGSVLKGRDRVGINRSARARPVSAVLWPAAYRAELSPLGILGLVGIPSAAECRVTKARPSAGLDCSPYRSFWSPIPQTHLVASHLYEPATPAALWRARRLPIAANDEGTSAYGLGWFSAH